MQNTLDIIKKDNLSARKNKHKFISNILTTLIGEIEIVGKNKNRITNEEETISVIKSFKKKANETLEAIKSREDESLISKIKEEIKVYDNYLPKMLSEIELTNIIKDIIGYDKDANFGSIMKFLKTQYNGKYDGKTANSIIKKLIVN